VSKPISNDTPWADVTVETKRIMADLAEVRGKGSSTAKGMIGMLEKQLKSLSVPSWQPWHACASSAIGDVAGGVLMQALQDLGGESEDAAAPAEVGVVRSEGAGSAGADVDAGTRGELGGVDAQPDGARVAPLGNQCEVEVNESSEFKQFNLRKTIPATIELYEATTDAGGDIAGAKTIAATEVALCGDDFKWWLDFDCLGHQFQLCHLG
jgi:hypothetical protein